MNCLLKLVVVEDCSDFAITVTGPVRLEYLCLRLAHVRLGAVLVYVEVREVGGLPLDCPIMFVLRLVVQVDHLLPGPFQHVPSDPLEGGGGDGAWSGLKLTEWSRYEAE